MYDYCSISISNSDAGSCSLWFTAALCSVVLATPGFIGRHHNVNQLANSLERTPL